MNELEKRWKTAKSMQRTIRGPAKIIRYEIIFDEMEDWSYDAVWLGTRRQDILIKFQNGFTIEIGQFYYDYEDFDCKLPKLPQIWRVSFKEKWKSGQHPFDKKAVKTINKAIDLHLERLKTTFP